MNLSRLKCLFFSIALSLFVCPAAFAAPDVPWPSVEVMGELHKKVSELHKEELIKASLKEKYVAGDTNLVDIVYDHQYMSADKNGNLLFYRDYAVRANTLQATQALGEHTAKFNAAKGSADILLAEVYLPNGTKIATDASQCQLKEPFTSLVYSDQKVKVLSLKGIEEGSVLRLVEKKTYRPDVDKGFIFLPLLLETPVPAKEAVSIFHFEAGTKIIRNERINNPSFSLIARVHNTDKGDAYYLYSISDMKPKVPEAASVPAWERANRILFVSPSTWNDVAGWWSSLYEPKVSTSKQIREKALDLTANLPSREGKIKALYDFVKSIRYVSIHFNEGTYTPHPADETLKNMYGDCKDKSVLLLSLLRSVGIDGTVAMVRTSSLLDKEFPSPDYFDHTVVAIPTAKNSYEFLDATAQYVPYGLIPMGIQYRHALIPRGDKGELFLIPPQAPEMNRVEERIEAEMQDAQTVTVRSEAWTYTSNQWYHLLPTIPKPLLLQALKEAMAKSYKDFDIISQRIEPADAQDILKNEVKYKIRDFTKKIGNVYIFNPLIDADMLGDESIIGTSERKSEMELDGPKKLVANVTITLPASVSCDTLPKPFSIRNDKFGSYSYEISQSEGKLHVRREVRINAKRVAAKDYAEFRKFYRACLDQDEEMVGLKAK